MPRLPDENVSSSMGNTRQFRRRQKRGQQVTGYMRPIVDGAPEQNLLVLIQIATGTLRILTARSFDSPQAMMDDAISWFQVRGVTTIEEDVPSVFEPGLAQLDALLDEIREEARTDGFVIGSN